MHMNHLRFWSSPAPKHSSVIQRLLRVTAGVRLFLFHLAVFQSRQKNLLLAAHGVSFGVRIRSLFPQDRQAEPEGVPEFSHGLKMTHGLW